MEEKKIKYLGLYPITKKVYLILQSIAFIILISTIIFTFTFDLPDSFQRNFFFKNIKLIAIFVLIMETIETVYMLKKYNSND